MRNKKIWLLLLMAAAIYLLRQNKINALASPADNYIPEWVCWNEKNIISDSGMKLKLSDKRIELNNKSGKKIWDSDESFYVQDAFITDIDRDNDEELILLLWKKGRYGKHRPFWIEKDEDDYSQHIFLYEIEKEEIHQKWCTSDIGMLVNRMKLMEKNKEIILTEDIDGNNTLWAWKDFGLKNIDNGVRFISFGDNIIHKYIYEYAFNKEKGSFDFLYKPYLKEIEEADIAAIQLESILVDKKDAVSDYPKFGSPIEVGKSIKSAGFDIVSCANNHCVDKGITGIDVTTEFCSENNLTCVGIQNSKDKTYKPYELISKNGIKFAIFSYTYGTNEINISEKYPYAVHYLPKTEKEEKEFVNEISKAKDEADFTVVFVHWGNEYEKKISNDQIKITELLKKASVDVVIGTHPHVLQEVKTEKREDGGDMLIFYSLGNFVSGKMKNEDTDIGGEAIFTVEHSFEGVRLKNYELKEIKVITNYGK